MCLLSEMNQDKIYRRCLPAEKRIKEKYFWCPLLLTGTNEKSALDEVAHKNVIRAKKWLIKM